MAEPTKIRYVGGFDAVDVPALGQTVKRNHQVAVDDKTLAASLLEQSDWEEVGVPKAAKAETEEEQVVKGG